MQKITKKFIGEARAKAHELGLKTYWTGKPCKHGHISKRLLINRTCWECDKIEHARQAAKPHRKLWRAEYSKKYRTANPEKIRLLTRVNQSRRRSKNGKHTKEDISSLLLIQKGKCANCSKD